MNLYQNKVSDIPLGLCLTLWCKQKILELTFTYKNRENTHCSDRGDIFHQPD